MRACRDTVPEERTRMAKVEVSISEGSAGPEGPSPQSLAEQVRRKARSLGFDAVGIARADVSLDTDIAHYDAFVAAGMHGEMDWLARHRPARVRADGDEILPGARSVICVARRYRRPPEIESNDSGMARGIARYARGRDYHGFLRRRIRKLAAFVRLLAEGARARPICDDAPLLERAWAARAGLGFVGKNGLLIVPGVGSFVLLGEVVTTLALEPNEPIGHRCGACTRCLDACPTRAFAAPFVLDARRCIAYLTIEHKTAVDSSLREGVGEHLFGCDDCQTVCPFNGGASTRAPLSASGESAFAPLEAWSRVRLEEILALDEAVWLALAEGSPLKRAGRASLARNAAIVLGNRGDPAARDALMHAAHTDERVVVREAAAWALDRLARR
jgi:epoxyqueuosine reductase